MSYVAFVEHSHVLQKMLTQLCAERGVECRAVDGTVAALAMIAAEAPLAIVAGLEQKDLSAVSLVAALKCDRTLASIPIAVMTTECKTGIAGLHQPDRLLCRDSEWLANTTEFLAPVFERSHAPAEVAKPRVLLVEDSATLQRIAAHILHIGGCEVTIVDNGRRAIDTLAEAPFDLVFMDIEMPVMDGRETIRRIRADGNRIPVWALTAHEPEHFEREARELGFDGMCTKPIRRDPLLAATAAGLRRAAALVGNA
ncbi:MAG: response regulator [Planctomycetota bacterium]